MQMGCDKIYLPLILDATDAILMILPDLRASIYMEKDKGNLV